MVVLPAKRPHPLNSVNRFTLKVGSADEVEEAHADFTANAKGYGLNEVGELRTDGDGASFIISDLDRNWWEVASEPSLSRD